MTKEVHNPVLFVPINTPLRVEVEGTDYPFSCKLVRKTGMSMLISRDPAMEAFEDMVKQGAPLTIKFHRETVFYRFSAILEYIPAEPDQLLEIGKLGRVENIERRSAFRIPCDLAANLEVKRNLDVSVTDINKKGCRVRFPVPADPESGTPIRKTDRVRIRIRIPGKTKAVLVEGEVRNLVSSKEGMEAGILFDRFPQELRPYFASLLEQKKKGKPKR